MKQQYIPPFPKIIKLFWKIIQNVHYQQRIKQLRFIRYIEIK